MLNPQNTIRYITVDVNEEQLSGKFLLANITRGVESGLIIVTNMRI